MATIRILLLNQYAFPFLQMAGAMRGQIADVTTWAILLG